MGDGWNVDDANWLIEILSLGKRSSSRDLFPNLWGSYFFYNKMYRCLSCVDCLIGVFWFRFGKRQWRKYRRGSSVDAGCWMLCSSRGELDGR
jgi:hypothetical protein